MPYTRPLGELAWKMLTCLPTEPAVEFKIEVTGMDFSGIDPSVAPSGRGCAQCEEQHGWWFHLRRCAQCGHIGCCDSSPSRHASVHARVTGYLWITSYEPGEDWFYDYRSQRRYEEGPRLAPPEHHPVDQPAPGPVGRVPVGWERMLH